jgi:hypothetical protein
MNLALEELADNPIIDELVRWPPRSQRMISIRACSVLFRKPFIEVQLDNGEVFQRHFQRAGFARDWAEASVILETLTAAKIVSEFDFAPLADREALEARVNACRDECVAEANKMYEQGFYKQFLHQFGVDYRDLSEETVERIAHARQAIAQDRLDSPD